MILTVLTGIGLAFTVLSFIGILAVIIGILRDNIGDGLTETGETFVYRVLPVTVFVLFTFGTVLVEVGTDPENQVSGLSGNGQRERLLLWLCYRE